MDPDPGRFFPTGHRVRVEGGLPNAAGSLRVLPHLFVPANQ